ncbi:hypothetical protein A7985_16990 [Pseudoalteromonas luteoviolacea]|uniref:DUF2982 domain-containing protein n=1 Tax=Pseudoalteromonas luteoviolacea TaxID=43657 RepID=A0A1C0TMY0_9GAMM|nr:DUF2982 domain-containing protein [Pseudoalteromonas luteoviolacea]MBQ4811995.1 DUF2982 domain-containing protein [Pseudoalteromonas luteoviolacea]OCQ20131.1 hypothetical protein A7985_16990 [Pseudoalteromonas luteoviolacea]
MHKVSLRAQANRHSIEFMLAGAVCLAIIMVFVTLRATPPTILELAFSAAAICSILLGFLKSQQPYFSIELSTEALNYVHKFGVMRVSHANFHSSGVPFVTQGVENLELNAVGIKLNSIDEFLAELTPRLAGKLLIEQRHIFLQAVKIHCANGNCPSEWLIEETSYQSPKGRNYTGLMAMFANRMQNLKTVTGYDLILPANVLDRDIWQFANILNHWKTNPEKVVKDLHDEVATAK